MKIKTQKSNPELHREELLIEIVSDTTPTKKQIFEFLNKSEEVVVIKRINSNFGRKTFTADVLVYESPEKRQEIEVVPQKVKKKLAEEAKKKAEEEAKRKAEEEKAKAEAQAQENKSEEQPKTE
jgi:ribosomal protein S24E